MSPLRPPETYLAFDYGLRRTGVASGSRTLGRGSLGLGHGHSFIADGVNFVCRTSLYTRQ